jgi:hypothetical protein
MDAHEIIVHEVAIMCSWFAAFFENALVSRVMRRFPILMFRFCCTPAPPARSVQLGKLIGYILTGQLEDRAPDQPEDSNKDRAAVALGRKGGLKGGKALLSSWQYATGQRGARGVAEFQTVPLPKKRP